VVCSGRNRPQETGWPVGGDDEAGSFVSAGDELGEQVAGFCPEVTAPVLCARLRWACWRRTRTMAQVSLTKANLRHVTKFVITRCRTRL
jgi:hypothetical protein